jgi:hypothetical protein
MLRITLLITSAIDTALLNNLPINQATKLDVISFRQISQRVVDKPANRPNDQLRYVTMLKKHVMDSTLLNKVLSTKTRPLCPQH